MYSTYESPSIPYCGNVFSAAYEKIVHAPTIPAEESEIIVEVKTCTGSRYQAGKQTKTAVA